MDVTADIRPRTLTSDDATGAVERRGYARTAGIALLVGLASIVVLYAGSGAVAGTRPDSATDLATVAGFYGHQELAVFFLQAVISVFGIVVFALAFRRYLASFAGPANLRLLADVGAALVLVEAPALFVVFGLELGLVRLVGLGDKTAVLGVFMAFDWIDNGTILWLEVGWLGALSLAALLTGALPRWLAGYGLVVSLLIFVFAAPGLFLGFPVGTALLAYGPWMLWMLITGVYLARGGRTLA
jgi:hypothetical protein